MLYFECKLCCLYIRDSVVSWRGSPSAKIAPCVQNGPKIDTKLNTHLNYEISPFHPHSGENLGCFGGSKKKKDSSSSGAAASAAAAAGAQQAGASGSGSNGAAGGGGGADPNKDGGAAGGARPRNEPLKGEQMFILQFANRPLQKTYLFSLKLTRICLYLLCILYV